MTHHKMASETVSIRYASQGTSTIYTKGLAPTKQSPVALLLAFPGYVILVLALLLGISACTTANVPLEKAIIGKWVNHQGGEIEFFADGTGFIPGLGGDDNVPDTKFTYVFPDDTHLSLLLTGQRAILIEIEIEGDRMTWRDSESNVEFEYRRAK